MVSNYPNYSVDHLSLGFIHLLRVQRSDAGNEPGWRWQHVGDRSLFHPSPHLIERASWVSAANLKHFHETNHNLHTETLAEF
jgi:hypothetical protein